MRVLAPGVLSSFFCYVLDKAQQVLCKNVGCNAVFKWRMKHHQHMKTYLHQQPNKGYIIKDGQYICGKCFKYIKHQSNIPRHLKTCKQKVKNTSYNCTFCEKIFKFPCCLKEHLAFHAKQTEKKRSLIAKKFLNVLTIIELSRAVITKNLHYNSAEDIHQYLSDLFKDKTKFYTILTSEDIKSFKNDNSPLIIKGCLKIHMLSFFPDGSIQSKINICSCKSCIKCGFVSCLTEKGKTVQQVTEPSEDDSTTESEF